VVRLGALMAAHGPQGNGPGWSRALLQAQLKYLAISPPETLHDLLAEWGDYILRFGATRQGAYQRLLEDAIAAAVATPGVDVNVSLETINRLALGLPIYYSAARSATEAFMADQQAQATQAGGTFTFTRIGEPESLGIIGAPPLGDFTVFYLVRYDVVVNGGAVERWELGARIDQRGAARSVERERVTGGA
jgi:hypothetical protein